MDGDNKLFRSKDRKIKYIDDSIKSLVTCVKYLESIQTYKLLHSVNNTELEKVVEHLKKLEESIDKINTNHSTNTETGKTFKAIGNGRTLIVKKPVSYLKDNNKNYNFKNHFDEKRNSIFKTKKDTAIPSNGILKLNTENQG